MAALPLLTKKGEDEESALKRWLGYAFYVVTVFLMCLNVSGAWIVSNGNLFYTGSIAGAEMFVALALGALIYTRNNLRFGVGLVVFLVGVYITLENGKMAVTHAMSDVFTGTPAELTEKANLADTVAGKLETADTDSTKASATNLTAVRTEIAELRAEQRTLASTDIFGIQRILQAHGYYSKATLDGIRGEETERGIVTRGDEVRARLAVLAEMEAMAMAPPPAVVKPEAETVTRSEAELKRAEAIELRKQATEVSERTAWMTILLLGLEGIRSLALWVFLMDGTMSASRLRKKAYENLKLAEINVEIAEVNAKIAALSQPKPVAPPEIVTPTAPIVTPPVSITEPPEKTAEIIDTPLSINQGGDSAEIPSPISPEPEPAPAPAPAVERSDASQLARHAAKSLHKQRRADALEDVILVDDNRERNAALEAAKEAAQ